MGVCRGFLASDKLSFDSYLLFSLFFFGPFTISCPRLVVNFRISVVSYISYVFAYLPVHILFVFVFCFLLFHFNSSFDLLASPRLLF